MNSDKKIKSAIKSAFDLPNSNRKQDFLISINKPRINLFEFFMTQLQYVSKRVFIIESLIIMLYLVGILGIDSNNLNMMYIPIASAIAPLLVLLMVTEIYRSMSYNMAELEMTTKYSLNQIIIARITILGTINFICLVLMLTLTSFKLRYSIFLLGLHIFIPFLLACFCSLYAMNYIRNQNINYYCAVISIFISVSNIVLYNIKYSIFDFFNIQFWLVVFILLIIGIVIQARKFIKSTEEYNWN